jgi:hypothetical protein
VHCNKGVTIGILNTGDVASIPASRRRTESFCDSLRRLATMLPAEPAPTATKEYNVGCITAKTFHFTVGCAGSVEHARQENCIMH